KAQYEMYGTIYDRLTQLLNKGRGPGEAEAAQPAKKFDAPQGNTDEVVARARRCWHSRRRNSQRRWEIPTSSCVARSRACGPTCHRTLRNQRATMKRERLLALLMLLAALFGLWWYFGLLPVDPVVVSTFAASQDASAAQTSEAQLATVKQYCVTCHNDRAKTGGVSFEGLTPDSIGQHADVFEKAVRKLRGRVMPPPSARQPDAHP